MRPFPPIWKFKKFHKRERRKTVLSVDDIIGKSSNVKDCLSKIKNITRREINIIERRTRKQAKDDEWFHYRKGMITGTLTSRISNAVRKGGNIDSINQAISKHVQFPLNYL